MTHYKQNFKPGKPPTQAELNAYMARIAGLGQVDYCRFRGSGPIGILVTGIVFILSAVGIALVYFEVI